MKITINEKEVNENSVNVNSGLNFGRFDFQDVEISNYRITLTFEEFISIIENEYNFIRDEIQKDDETYQEISDFSEINYGSINELLKNKQMLSEITKGYLDKIIFTKLFSKSQFAHFIINSTDFVTINNQTLEIIGRCFQKK